MILFSFKIFNKEINLEYCVTSSPRIKSPKSVTVVQFPGYNAYVIALSRLNFAHHLHNLPNFDIH